MVLMQVRVRSPVQHEVERANSLDEKKGRAMGSVSVRYCTSADKPFPSERRGYQDGKEE